MNKHPEQVSISVKRKSNYLVDRISRKYYWLLALCLSGFTATPLFAHVCSGMSLERAYHRSDAVMEVELQSTIPPDYLNVTFVQDGDPTKQIKHRYGGNTFRVINVWKGKSVESVRIYGYGSMEQTYYVEGNLRREFTIGTGRGSFSVGENERHIVFATLYKPKGKRKSEFRTITRSDGTQEENFLTSGYCRGNAILK